MKADFTCLVNKVEPPSPPSILKKRAPWKCPKSLPVQFLSLPIRHWPWISNYWMILKEKKLKKEFGRSSICANWVAAAAASKSWIEKITGVLLYVMHGLRECGLKFDDRNKKETLFDLRFFFFFFSFFLSCLSFFSQSWLTYKQRS